MAGDTLQVRYRRKSFWGTYTPLLAGLSFAYFAGKSLLHFGPGFLLNSTFLGFSAAAVVLLGLAYVGYLNRRVLTVDRAFVRAAWHPVPRVGTLRLPMKSVRRVYLNRRTLRTRFGPRVVCDIVFRDRSGDTHVWVSDLEDPERARWLLAAAEVFVEAVPSPGPKGAGTGPG